MKRYFYAAENRYGTWSSIGFNNSWHVLVFSNRRDRDEWVESRDTLSAMAIRRENATRLAANWNSRDNRFNEPRPFTAEFWGISDFYSPFFDDDEQPAGYVGMLVVCDPYTSEGQKAERFY